MNQKDFTLTIKKIQERTTLPYLECKSAFEEAKGDVDIAIDILKERIKKHPNLIKSSMLSEPFNDKNKQRVASNEMTNINKTHIEINTPLETKKEQVKAFDILLYLLFLFGIVGGLIVIPMCLPKGIGNTLVLALIVVFSGILIYVLSLIKKVGHIIDTIKVITYALFTSGALLLLASLVLHGILHVEDARNQTKARQYAQLQQATRPFLPTIEKLKESYSHLVSETHSLLPPSFQFSGKCIVVDMPKAQISLEFSEIKETLRARNSQEVDYIIIIQAKRESAGFWRRKRLGALLSGERFERFFTQYKISVIDWKSKRIVGTDNISSSLDDEESQDKPRNTISKWLYKLGLKNKEGI